MSVLAMKSLQAIRRFISNAWLAAAPLVVLFGLVVGVPILVGIAHWIVARVSDPETADNLLMDVGMTAAAMVLLLTPAGLAIYAIVRLAKWLIGKKEP